MTDERDRSVGFVWRVVGVFGYSRRALHLVWTTSRGLTFTLAILTLTSGVAGCNRLHRTIDCGRCGGGDDIDFTRYASSVVVGST